MSCYHSVMVSWYHNVMVSQCHGVMVSWCYDEDPQYVATGDLLWFLHDWEPETRPEGVRLDSVQEQGGVGWEQQVIELSDETLRE